MVHGTREMVRSAKIVGHIFEANSWEGDYTSRCVTYDRYEAEKERET